MTSKMPSVSYESVNGGEKRCQSGKCKCCCICISIVIITVLCVFLGFFLYLFITLGHVVPFHASCRVTWTVNEACSNINKGLAEQIDDWGMNHTCGTGQRCLYELSTNNITYLTGTHETPVMRYVDDISYMFLEHGQNDCEIKGYSTSQLWYAILDYGTNYCNIHNLMFGPVIGSLNATIDENTSNAICTQYSSADCDIY